MTIEITDIENSDCWTISYSISRDDETAAKKLSEIDEYSKKRRVNHLIDDKNSEFQNDEETIKEEKENIENVGPSINNNENLESALLALSNAAEKIHSSLTKVVNDSAKIVLDRCATIAKSLRTPAIDQLLESSLGNSVFTVGNHGIVVPFFLV